MIKTLQLSENRLLQFSRFVEETQTLYAGGVEGVFRYKLLYTGATDKKHTHKLDPLGSRLEIRLKLKKRLDGVSQWVKGMQYDTELDVLFAWSLSHTSIYQLSTGMHYFTFENLLGTQEDLITDVLYMPKYRYIVICSKQAKLQVYKWAAISSLVTEFKGMDRPIKGLARHPNRVNQFVTAGLDLTIRIWCLEKFTCQYVLKIPFEIKNIILLDNLQFACF